MSQIYQSFEIKPADTLDERISKLYMGVISVGEDLYCKGSAIAELAKSLTAMERTIHEMRIELARIKLLARTQNGDGVGKGT